MLKRIVQAAWQTGPMSGGASAAAMAIGDPPSTAAPPETAEAPPEPAAAPGGSPESAAAPDGSHGEVTPGAPEAAVEDGEWTAPDDPAVNPEIGRSVLEARSLSLWYGDNRALHDISLKIQERQITAFIGPSGCGKSTLLRCFNRLNDLVDEVRIEGDIRFDGASIYDAAGDVNALRKSIGMVFQSPNPFPKSIYENIAYGARIHGVRGRSELDEIVEKSLRGAALWDEVKDRLSDSALGLSGGQQQRLCIARAIAIEPEVVLLDEPCSALDPIATAKIEELMIELKKDYTLIIVTHNMQQASRVSDLTAFMYLGRLIEYRETEEFFIRPRKKRTEDYITGRFG